jgi:intein/homing endonuclease
MILLEKEFESAPGAIDGLRIFTQLNRNDKVAIYKRVVKRTGTLEGYEVFSIKTDPKGKVQKFPNGSVKVLEDDTEKYPASGVFGFSAWYVMTYERATQIFDELTAEAAEKANPTPEKAIVVPAGEFSTTELATANEIEYPVAALFIKAALGENTIKFSREERRNAKGKATKLYIKA